MGLVKHTASRNAYQHTPERQSTKTREEERAAAGGGTALGPVMQCVCVCVLTTLFRPLPSFFSAKLC